MENEWSGLEIVAFALGPAVRRARPLLHRQSLQLRLPSGSQYLVAGFLSVWLVFFYVYFKDLIMTRHGIQIFCSFMTSEDHKSHSQKMIFMKKSNN